MKIATRRSWGRLSSYLDILVHSSRSPGTSSPHHALHYWSSPRIRQHEKLNNLDFRSLHSAALNRTQLWSKQSGRQAFELLYRPLQVAYRALVILGEAAWLTIWHYAEKDIKRRAEQLRKSLIRLGPFYIKLGQALSTRPDILPNAYCSELSKLQDQIPPFPSKRALKFIEAELGAPLSRLFAEISPEPLAAASLGQVYKARLHTGELVAVKVLRPNVPAQLALDARLLHLVGGQLQRFAKARGDIAAVVNEMVAHMLEETDYVKEGRNTERFAGLYGIDYEEKNGGVKRRNAAKRKKGLVKVPKIYWDHTSSGVLTMEWIDGVKLTNKDKLESMNLNVQELVHQGVFCSLRQLLEDGYFHADPHPGNLVVTKDGVLAYFDFGMMSDFPRHYRIGLIRTLVHFVNRDSEGLARDFLLLGFIPQQTDLKPIVEALRASFGDENTKAQLDFQGIMNQLSDVMYEFNFRLPPEFGLVIRALGSLEGTATALDPDFRVIESAYPFIIGRLLSDADPDMRQILYELLIRTNGSIRWHRLEKLLLAISQEQEPASKKDPSRESRGSAFNMRAVASATDDVLTYILSEKGIRVRILLVKDIVKALDLLIKESVYEFYGLDKNQEAARPKQAPVEPRAVVYAASATTTTTEGTSGQVRVTFFSRFRSWAGGGGGTARPKSSSSGSRRQNPDSRGTVEPGKLRSRVGTGLQAFFSAVSAAPEVWLPLLVKVAADREAQRLFVAVLRAALECYKEQTSEAGFIFMSKQLHQNER